MAGLVCIVLFCCAGPARALFRMQDPSQSTFVETIDVHLVDRSSETRMASRQKRDTSGLPSFLHFNVTTKDGTVTQLKLLQHEQTFQTFPVFVVREGQLVETDVEHPSGWALYTDRGNGATMHVHSDTLDSAEDYLLNGVFHHGNLRVQIRPDHHYDGDPSHPHARTKRSQAGEEPRTPVRLPHILADVNSTLSFGDDEVMMPSSPHYNFDASKFSLGDSAPILNPTRSSKKRSAIFCVDNVVETFLAADYFDYKQFLTDANNDEDQAKSDMVEWYSFVIHAINSMLETYEAQSESHCIRVRIVGMMIANVKNEALWISRNVRGKRINAYGALQAFSETVQDLFAGADGERHVKPDSICETLFCATDESCTHIEYWFSHDYISCGDQKWCYQGRCVPRSP